MRSLPQAAEENFGSRTANFEALIPKDLGRLLAAGLLPERCRKFRANGNLRRLAVQRRLPKFSESVSKPAGWRLLQACLNLALRSRPRGPEPGNGFSEMGVEAARNRGSRPPVPAKAFTNREIGSANWNFSRSAKPKAFRESKGEAFFPNRTPRGEVPLPGIGWPEPELRHPQSGNFWPRKAGSGKLVREQALGGRPYESRIWMRKSRRFRIRGTKTESIPRTAKVGLHAQARLSCLQTWKLNSPSRERRSLVPELYFARVWGCFGFDRVAEALVACRGPVGLVKKPENNKC